MPMMLPMLPPMIAIMNKVDSGTLHRCFLARYLSSPIRNKPTRLTPVKYASSKVITFISMTIPFPVFFRNRQKYRCHSVGICFRRQRTAPGVLFFLSFLHFHGTDFAGEAEEVDKAFRIVVVIQVAGGEGSDAFII